MAKKGIFITFEGSEGCGKTTQIRFVREFMNANGIDCVVSREPGGTELSEKIRDLLLNAKEGQKMSPKTEMLLFAASRAQHVDELIRPSLEAGKCVICDRFTDSTSAYQGVARNLGADLVEKTNSIATGSCTPDITFLLDIDVELGISRTLGRDSGKTDRMGSQKIEFYKRVRESYLQLASENPSRIFVIDASLSPDEVFAQIKQILLEKVL